MLLRMRTTLTIDSDVEQLLIREMRRTNRSMKAVVNDTLRAGFGERGKAASVARYMVEPHAFGFKPGIDPYRLNQLADELETKEFTRRRAR